MSLAILFHFLCTQHVSDINIHPSSGACDCAVELPHWSFCSRFVVCWKFGAAGLSSVHVAGFGLQQHQISNTQRTENKTTNVVIQQHSRKLLMMDTY